MEPTRPMRTNGTPMGPPITRRLRTLASRAPCPGRETIRRRRWSLPTTAPLTILPSPSPTTPPPTQVATIGTSRGQKDGNCGSAIESSGNSRPVLYLRPRARLINQLRGHPTPTPDHAPKLTIGPNDAPPPSTSSLGGDPTRRTHAPASLACAPATGRR